MQLERKERETIDLENLREKDNKISSILRLIAKSKPRCSLQLFLG